MGRLPKSGNHVRKRQFEDLRSRHRNADCKYRSKVQYLYFKIRSLIKKKTAKDGLLDNALGFIQNLENKISQARGSNHLDVCKKEFFNFIVEEEALWKKEKDVTKWWLKVEDLLNKKQGVNFSGNKSTIFGEDKNENCNQQTKPSKRPYRKRIISSKNKNDMNLKNVKCCCMENRFCDVRNNYDVGFKEENSLSSPAWITPEVVYSSPIVHKDSEGAFPYEEIRSDDSINSMSSNVFNTTEVAVDASNIPVPVENVMFDTSGKSKSFLLYL